MREIERIVESDDLARVGPTAALAISLKEATERLDDVADPRRSSQTGRCAC